MNKNFKDKITNIKENTFATVVVFPEVVDGMVPFYLSDHFTSKDNSISFSVVVSICLKQEINETIFLRLVQLNKNDFAYRTLNLDEIRLFKEDSDTDCTIKSIRVEENENLTNEYCIRKNYTFAFNNVPILGPGRYAVILAIAEDDIFFSLAEHYINVE